MNKVSIFEHPEFGRIRTLEIDGKIWFCASDVAAALGYSNPRDAVVRHCKPMGVVVCRPENQVHQRRKRIPADCR